MCCDFVSRLERRSVEFHADWEALGFGKTIDIPMLCGFDGVMSEVSCSFRGMSYRLESNSFINGTATFSSMLNAIVRNRGLGYIVELATVTIAVHSTIFSTVAVQGLPHLLLDD